MKPEFHFTRHDFTASFEAICGTVADAQKLLEEFPRICGVPLRCEGDTLMFTLPLDDLDEAIVLLEQAGYVTVDLVDRDEDYAIQEYEGGLDREESDES